MTTIGPDGPELVTPAEFARALNLDAKTIGRWTATGKLRCVRTLGNHRRLFRADLDAIIAGTYVMPPASAVKADDPTVFGALGLDLDVDAAVEL